MSLTPAYDQLEVTKKREAIELCGKNRGPHDYIPIEWRRSDTSERVTRMMCRICFTHISILKILENPDYKNATKEC